MLALALLAFRRPTTPTLDHWVWQWFLDHRIAALNPIAIIFSDLTRPIVLCALAILWSLWWYLRAHQSKALLPLSIVLAAIACEAVKELVDRLRPTMGLIEPSSYSMPSGHTTTAFAFATVVVIVSRSKWRHTAWLAAGTIALSRLYLGVHWASDVVIGALFGIGIVVLCEVLRVVLSAVVGASTSKRKKLPGAKPRG